MENVFIGLRVELAMLAWVPARAGARQLRNTRSGQRLVKKAEAGGCENTRSDTCLFAPFWHHLVSSLGRWTLRR